jgi:hypothetical protein
MQPIYSPIIQGKRKTKMTMLADLIVNITSNQKKGLACQDALTLIPGKSHAFPNQTTRGAIRVTRKMI